MAKAKPIIIYDNEKGVEYTLEFNRETVVFAERRGFSPDDVERFFMTKMPEFWYYAFRMHHRNISREKTDKLLEAIGGVNEEIFTRLLELWSVPYETILNMSDDGNEEETKNPNFRVEL